MKTTELEIPKVPTDRGRIFDMTEPIIRLEQMDAAEYERVVGEWAYSYLKGSKDYYDVVLMGGSSDSGRDLVAYLDDTYNRYDIYQCKHYDTPLKPSEYWIELGKLCYYTYVKEYRIPEKYYIVASKGIGAKLRKYIENPTIIGAELIKQWVTYCGGKKQILAEGITLTNELKTYIEQFDFSIIVIWCPGGETRPYSSPKTMEKNNKERIHYIRKSSNSVEPTDDEEKDLFNLANRVPFDDRVNHKAEISDLNITLIQNYLKEVKSSLYEKSKTGDFVEVCQDMNIVSTLPEYIKPKNVGLMFFSMEPDKFFPYTQIDVVQFPSGLGGNDIIEKTFNGPIHQQLRDALQYIKNVIITEKVVKHPDRAEADRFFNFPYAAVEEALSNAVYHRAYDEREPIEVRVENDRIEIVSFPGPDRSVTIEGLKSYRVSNRRYRNRRIGDFLKELHLTEGRNTGFKKILDALEANGSPKPEFETDEDRSYFITRLFIHEAFAKDGNEQNLNVVSEKNERSLSEVLSEVLIKKDFDKVIPIIKYLEEKGYITPKEAENVCDKSAATVRRYLGILTATGIVVAEGNTNNSIYRVKVM